MELIITPSGCRGVVGESLTAGNTLELSEKFGAWAKGKVIIGRDTRTSGQMLESAVIAGLLSQGCEVINCGVAPTPAIIHAKNKLGIKAGIIISGSHNPPEWNALKLMSDVSFTSKEEIEAIKKSVPAYKNGGELIYYDALKDYVKELLNFIKTRNTGIKVVLDTGAGAGKKVTPRVLESLGCELTLVNNDLIKGEFPRNPEPVKDNLSKLIDLMKTGRYEVGFAHDCDADRLAIVGDDGTLYREDIGLALIAKHEGKSAFVTNTASSLVFEELMGRENVIRTPVGERYLAIKLKELGNAFGGEGSCGGVMFPRFNNCRDGIFAAAKIIDILKKTGRKLSELVSELPKYYSERLILKGDTNAIMNKLKNSVENYEEVDNDIKINGPDWFVLAHPSNTEPIIRIISEARTPEKARELINWFKELV